MPSAAVFFSFSMAAGEHISSRMSGCDPALRMDPRKRDTVRKVKCGAMRFCQIDDGR